MTDRLYYRDAELLSFDATVTGTDGDPLHVVLDRTAFYPTSGGQPHDTGTLGGVAVLDVVEHDDRIVHVVAAPLAAGPVHGEVDPARRRDHMQQHTAQHLVSAIAADRLGWKTVSVHFGADHSSIEFDAASASDDQLAALEAEANADVAAALPVTVSFEDAAEAASRGLRKPSERGGTVRIITIAGIDRSACGGTHVANTAAIGPVVLTGTERIRGRVRVGFLAGGRVVRTWHEQRDQLAALAATLTCSAGELAEIVAKRQTELKGLHGAVEELEQEVAASRVAALVAGQAPGPDGVRWIVAEIHGSRTLLRSMAQAAASIEKTVLILVAPPAVFVAASPGSSIDAGSSLKEVLRSVGGRGGGNSTVAQGNLPERCDVAAFLASLAVLRR